MALTYATHNYFLQETAYPKLSGSPVTRIRFAREHGDGDEISAPVHNDDCRVNHEEPLASNGAAAASSAILSKDRIPVMMWPEAVFAGCKTYAHAITAISKSSFYSGGGNASPPSKPPLVLLAMVAPSTNFSGAPFSEPYMSFSFSIPDGEPPLPTVMLALAENDPFWPTMAADLPASVLANAGDVRLIRQSVDSPARGIILDASTPVIGSLTPADGVWNDVFLALGSYAIHWILFVLYFFLSFYGCMQLARMIRVRRFKWCMLNFVFLLVLLATIGYLPWVLIDEATLSSHLLGQSTSTLVTLAFFTMLYQWVKLLPAFLPKRHFLLYRIMIIFNGMVGIAASWAHTVIHVATGGQTDALDMARRVLVALSVSTLLFVGVGFAYYSYIFLIRWDSYATNTPLKLRLLQLNKLGSLAFAGFFCASIGNAISVFPAPKQEPRAWLGARLMVCISALLLSTSLVLLLGAEMTSGMPATETASANDNTTRSWLDTVVSRNTSASRERRKPFWLYPIWCWRNRSRSRQNTRQWRMIRNSATLNGNPEDSRLPCFCSLNATSCMAQPTPAAIAANHLRSYNAMESGVISRHLGGVLGTGQAANVNSAELAFLQPMNDNLEQTPESHKDSEKCPHCGRLPSQQVAGLSHDMSITEVWLRILRRDVSTPCASSNH
ncbi:hypothetical protein THASP1DRAFT_30188 [Thamnocephalis sphaerospora]|uniref:Uncharacterized protein n=1 Tax=Thamnocephalis sphaerospora TaxID=78915 RepID=A0A4P9XPQ9_9FUNG|nr:hypothetical protein THASP1DRAFT_30188 [Thamnocephalis sphaerospora]|eukprot:RKP08005.1 hypothetical protein THASP1DRAFT_30188 [Thamnocephalis sphaerospora]